MAIAKVSSKINESAIPYGMIKITNIPQQYQNKRIKSLIQSRYKYLPYGLLQKWIRTGKIKINNNKIKTDHRLQPDDTISLPDHIITYHKPGLNVFRNNQTLHTLRNNIIYQDDFCLVINKPCGIAVQGGSNVKDHIDLYLSDLIPDKQLYIVHRLDKDTSGLLILAKSSQSASMFMQYFKEHKINKTYYAVLNGVPNKKSGTISLAIGKMTNAQKEKMSSKADNLSPAITRYKVKTVEQDKHLSLVELQIETGKKHQIRVHMTEGLEIPILGDGKYGGKNAYFNSGIGNTRIPLHLAATNLQWQYDNGQKVDINIPLPNFFIMQ